MSALLVAPAHDAEQQSGRGRCREPGLGSGGIPLQLAGRRWLHARSPSGRNTKGERPPAIRNIASLVSPHDPAREVRRTDPPSPS